MDRIVWGSIAMMAVVGCYRAKTSAEDTAGSDGETESVSEMDTVISPLSTDSALQSDTVAYFSTDKIEVGETDTGIDSDFEVITETTTDTEMVSFSTEGEADTETDVVETDRDTEPLEDAGMVCDPGYMGKQCDMCDIEAGYIPVPNAPKQCILNPCNDMTCTGHGVCTVAEDGTASCGCDGAWRGERCNQKWQLFLGPGNVRDMAFDSDGNGWFATTSGLLYWDFAGTLDDTSDDGWQLFTNLDGSGSNLLETVVFDDQGGVWMAYNEGMQFLDPAGTPYDKSDDRWIRFDVSNGFPFRSVDGVLPVKNGFKYVWGVGGSEKLYLFVDNGTPTDTSDDEWHQVPLPNGRDDYLVDVREDPQGRLWLGCLYQLYVLDDQDTIEFEDDIWVTYESVDSGDISFDSLGHAWIAAEDGLFYLNVGNNLANTSDDQMMQFTDADGLPHNNLSHVRVDLDGGVWTGTSAAGSFYLDTNGTPLDKTDDTWYERLAGDDAPLNYQLGRVKGIGSDNSKWFYEREVGLVRLDGTTNPLDASQDYWIPYRLSECPLYDGVEYNGFPKVQIGAEGAKWSINWFLSWFDDNQTPFDKTDDTWMTYHYPYEDELEFYTSVFALDPNGGVWIASSSYNLVIYFHHNGTPTDTADDTWMRFDWDDGLGGAALGGIQAIAIDPDGGRWFGASSSKNTEVSHFDDNGTLLDKSDDTWTVFHKSEGISSWSLPLMAFDPHGGQWIAGDRMDYQGTLANKNDDLWSYQTKSRDLEGVAFDLSGDKWFVYNTVPILRYFADQGTPFDESDDVWVDFTMEDGVGASEGGAVLVDALGDVWVGSMYDSDSPVGLSLLNTGGTPADKSDDRWTLFEVADGVASRNVKSIVEDDTGGLWIGTSDGLSYLYYDR